MRIIEEEKSIPTRVSEQSLVAIQREEVLTRSAKKPSKAEVELEELDAGIKKAKTKQLHSYNRHSCLQLMGCFVLMLAVIFAAVGYLVIGVAGPIVKKVDELPKDFPQSLVLYQVDNAKIKVQEATAKTKAIQLIRALPAWALNPFVNYLSPEMKTQILANSQNLDTATSTLQLNDLEKALDTGTKTVSLSWDNINKTKEELVDYYKKQLKASGFEVKENVSDYEIDLRFLRGGVTGAMTVADSFTNNNSSLLKMTVNYLSGK